jgi:hypothetical protein
MEDTMNCLICHGTGKNRRGGPCPNCRGAGTIILSVNPMIRTVQIVGRTIGAAVLMAQALAALILALVVLAVIVVVTLIFMGVHV